MVGATASCTVSDEKWHWEYRPKELNGIATECTLDCADTICTSKGGVYRATPPDDSGEWSHHEIFADGFDHFDVEEERSCGYDTAQYAIEEYPNMSVEQCKQCMENGNCVAFLHGRDYTTVYDYEAQTSTLVASDFRRMLISTANLFACTRTRLRTTRRGTSITARTMRQLTTPWRTTTRQETLQ